MSETAADRIRRFLNAAGCYRLTGETSADWEGNACGAGVDAVEQALEALLEDLFPETASDQRLDAWEPLFRPQPAGGDLEQRRKMLGCRLAMNPRRFLPEDFCEMLPAAGVEGEVVEKDGGLQVLVGKRLGLTEQEIRRELDRMLPAQLPWEWVEDMNWAALDAYSVPFSSIDSRGISWDELDAMTLEQLRLLNEETAAREK